jgi:hypothetical protein
MVPDPSRVPVKAMSRIQRLVSRRLEVEDERIDQELERLVADLYGLTKAERLSVGMEA